MGECDHEALYLSGFEVCHITYDTKEQEYLESVAQYGYHITEGQCADCEQEFTADELLELGIHSVYKMRTKLIAQTDEHAKDYTTHPKYGRLTHWHRQRYHPTLWVRIKRRLGLDRDKTQPST